MEFGVVFGLAATGLTNVGCLGLEVVSRVGACAHCLWHLCD